MTSLKNIIAIVMVSTFIGITPLPLEAHDGQALSDSQTVYVPAYSHIYVGSNKRPFALAITLSIRNIDLDADIIISDVHYYGSSGGLIKSFTDEALTIRPQESVRFVIAENDKTGGSGANFIVKWRSATQVNPPIIESIMIGTQSGQGVSFSSRGRAIIN
ncbi:MAG: DUF3124 domain-containing protein [Desulfosarcinaceae bacterium]|nr:DUF3124 domain-containing protein [Desulfosarcinaceae bacterium]